MATRPHPHGHGHGDSDDDDDRASRSPLPAWPAPAALLAVLVLAACQEPTSTSMLPVDFTRAERLGGREVPAETLGRGAAIYTQSCRACHGADGGGSGPSGRGLRPPPRDLRLGTYKFGAVGSGQLPTDDDLRRIISGGLHGTAMLSWDLPRPQLDDVIQYIKTFSERWRSELPGEPIVLAPDPWQSEGPGPDRVAEGIARGTRVYHGLAQCAVACHPAYVTRTEIAAFTTQLSHLRPQALRADPYAPVAKSSDYGYPIVPPDFTFNVLRSGSTAADICRVVAAGVGGTAMPTWKNVLPDADLWALAHYVKSLADLRDTPGAIALRAALLGQPR
jgi:mono/diheme cytochrome c family protein